jgi:hypothetical protein
MPTGIAGEVTQQYHTNQLHYVAKTITFADDDLVVNIGKKLPPGAVVIDVGCVVTTAFSSNSVLDIGTSDDGDAFGSALVMTTAGAIRDVSTNPLIANDDYSASAGVQITASLTSSGSITVGSGVVFATYLIPDR